MASTILTNQTGRHCCLEFYWVLSHSVVRHQWVHSSVVRAADCRSAGPWFKSGCALLSVLLLSCSSHKHFCEPSCTGAREEESNPCMSPCPVSGSHVRPWVPLGAPGCPWVALGGPGCPWVFLGGPSPEGSWVCLGASGAPGFPWVPLGASG